MPHILTARSSRLACALALVAAAGGGCGDAGESDASGTAGGLTGQIAVTSAAGAYAFTLVAVDEFHIDNPDVEIAVRRRPATCPDGADMTITSGLRPEVCGAARPEVEAFAEFVSDHSEAIRDAARRR